MSDRFKDLTLELPNKLSAPEQEEFKKKFEAIKSLLDDSCEAVLEMDRDQAQRYYGLIVQGLQEADAKLVGGVKPVREVREENTQLEETEKRVLDRPQGFEFRRKGGAEEVVLRKGPYVPPRKAPDFDAIFAQLTPEAQGKARLLLECVKQYEDPEGPGIDIICTRCSIDAIQECLRSADPTIDDTLTHMIRAESERPR